MLAKPVAKWKRDGKEYAFSACDNDVELLFQACHEAWACERLEARRGKIGELAYRSHLERLGHALDANRFAFGGPLSKEWLVSKAGMVEYALLLTGKAGVSGEGKGATRAVLEKAAADSEQADWDRLWAALMRRDFPNLLGPEETKEAPLAPTESPSSPATATP
jgi:hypothetical protein